MKHQLRVTKEWFEDASEPDEDGFYDYYYAGFNYIFDLGDFKYYFRQYHDELQRASFMGRGTRSSKPERLTLESSPFDDYSFMCAAMYLFEEAGVKEICIYTPTEGAGRPFKPVVTLENLTEYIKNQLP